MGKTNVYLNNLEPDEINKLTATESTVGSAAIGAKTSESGSDDCAESDGSRSESDLSLENPEACSDSSKVEPLDEDCSEYKGLGISSRAVNNADEPTSGDAGGGLTGPESVGAVNSQKSKDENDLAESGDPGNGLTGDPRDN